jgi:hypothetical protein
LTALKSKYRVGIKASYYDALKLAAEKLEKCPTGRRVIAMLSDGLDSNSKASRRQAMTALGKVARRRLRRGLGRGRAQRSRVRRRLDRRARTQHLGDGGTHAQNCAATCPSYSTAARFCCANWPKPAGAKSGYPKRMTPLCHPRTARWSGEIGAQYSLAFITETKPSLETDARDSGAWRRGAA